MGKSGQYYKDDLRSVYRLGHILTDLIQLGKTGFGNSL